MMYGANIRTSLASWFCGHGPSQGHDFANGNVEFVNQRARSYRPVLLMGVSRSLECGWPSTFSPSRILCGSGQQHPLRAPRRVQRIAFEIVSSGVCMSSRCRLRAAPG